MKKLLSLTLTMLLLMLLIACGNASNDDHDSEHTEPNYTDMEPGSDNPVETYVLRTFSTTDEYGNAGTYSDIDTAYASGDSVPLEATVKDGYNFEGWFIGDVCISKELNCTFTMKADSVDVEARYSYYTVTVESYTDEEGTAGTFTKKRAEKVSIGETVTLTATANKGFNFEGWFINGTQISTDSEYSFQMKDEDIHIEAVYSYYTLTVESWSDEQGMAGTYPKKNNEKISVGETVTLTATVADGYNFEGWYVNNVCVCPDLTYQFVMDSESKTVYAEYSYYTFSAYGYARKSGWMSSPLEDVMGTCTTYDNQKMSAGEVIHLKATVHNGYTFEGWYLGDICVSTEMEYTYTMGKENISLEARYTYYTITCYFADQESIFWIDEPLENKIQVGDTVTLTAKNIVGYKFTGWKHGDIIISNSPTYTFIMDASDDTYEAVYEKINS